MYTNKKENKISLGLGAKSDMRKGFLIYEDNANKSSFYEEAVSHI